MLRKDILNNKAEINYLNNLTEEKFSSYLQTAHCPEVDLFIRTKENPVTPITEKCYIHWKTIFIDGFEYKLERFFPDYGWADLYQRKKLSEIALLYNYDVFYHVIYDTKFDDNLINGNLNISENFLEINFEKVISYIQFVSIKFKFDSIIEIHNSYIIFSRGDKDYVIDFLNTK